MDVGSYAPNDELIYKPIIVKLIFQAQLTPLHEAAKYGCIDCVQSLVDKGADVNCRTKVSIHFYTTIIKIIILLACSNMQIYMYQFRIRFAICTL